jgi:hypothetical protein
MPRRTKLISVGAIALVCGLLALPIWGMGPAAFLDSERLTLSRVVSPDGGRVAQVERIVVGGAPSIVVTVRPRWMPDWYLSGCAAASHYANAEALVAWTSENAIVVRHTDDKRFWKNGSGPFHNKPCDGLTVTFESRTQ